MRYASRVAPRDVRRVIARGRVQGVGYRDHAARAARALRIAGWVRNLSDGSVEAHGEGSADDLDAWIACLRAGPRHGRVDHLEVGGAPPDESGDFRVLPTV